MAHSEWLRVLPLLRGIHSEAATSLGCCVVIYAVCCNYKPPLGSVLSQRVPIHQLLPRMCGQPWAPTWLRPLVGERPDVCQWWHCLPHLAAAPCGGEAWCLSVMTLSPPLALWDSAGRVHAGSARTWRGKGHWVGAEVRKVTKCRLACIYNGAELCFFYLVVDNNENY